MNEGMTVHESSPVVRVRDLHDLLGVIPHLLGFHPDESLVIMVMVDSRVQVTARVDLIDIEPSGHLELLLDRLLLRWPTARLWLVGYSVRASSAWRLLQRALVHVGDTLAGEPLCVSAGHYRVGGPDGPQFRYDPTCTRSAASATVHGLQARPSRVALRDSVRVNSSAPAEAESAWVTALDRLVATDEQLLPIEMARAVSCHVLQPMAVAPTELAWLAVLAQVPSARDRALVAISRNNADAQVELWSRVVRCCPYGTTQQALALLGMAAWVSGNGALQSVCLEELEQQGANLPLQSLLEDLNGAIVPPSYWDELRPKLLEAIAPLEPLQVRTDETARRVGQPHSESADHHVA